MVKMRYRDSRAHIVVDLWMPPRHEGRNSDPGAVQGRLSCLVLEHLLAFLCVVCSHVPSETFSLA